MGVWERGSQPAGWMTRSGDPVGVTTRDSRDPLRLRRAGGGEVRAGSTTHAQPGAILTRLAVSSRRGRGSANL